MARRKSFSGIPPSDGSHGHAYGGARPKGTGGNGGGVGLRDLLSSVAQQVESHLHPPAPAPTSVSTSSLSLSPSTHGHGQVGRRRSRIRSWIGYDKERNTPRDDDDHCSLCFTDSSDDDDFQVVEGPTGERKTVTRDEVLQPQRHRGRTQTRTQHAQARDATGTSTNAANAGKSKPGPKPNPTPRQETTTMQLTPEELREEETIDMLTGLMGDGFDREVARRILRKYDGNVDKAAGALLEGERGDELLVSTPSQNQTLTQNDSHTHLGRSQSQGWPAMPGPGGGRTHAPTGGRPNTPIDLTLDDDPDLQRAVQESMSSLHAGSQSQSQMQVYAPAYTQSQLQGQSTSQVYATSQGQGSGQGGLGALPERPVFGPSERPPDPNWAIVPSHQNETNDASYLDSLNRAIEASLETMGDSDALEPFPVEQQLRRDGCPVVLRPSLHAMVYAASILQGLFYVPQVRERMASWRPPVPENEEEVAPPMYGPDFTLWALSEIFTHMDLARLCDLNVDKHLPAFNIEPWDRPAQPPGELSRKFFARFSATLEKAFVEQFAFSGQPLPKPRLLHFQYGSGVSEPGELLQETSIVPIDVNGGESNDLIGRLSAQLSKPQSEPGKQCVIFEPSEVVAFELVRASVPSTSASGGGSDRKPFTYPKSIYLDQFLRENVELAQAKRAQREEMLKEVQRLVLHKHTLTNFDGKDTLKDLRSSIFYFENVADAKGDLERGNSIQATTRKLKSILTTIEDAIKVTEERIATLRSQADTLLECQELQQYKYDLRVVFVHDGLYGRKHLYSYVHDKSCWWKIADSLIEKVPEDVVLNDQAGLHLGAGPYLLFYSRVTEEGPAPVLPWMDDIKDDVKAANREFLSQLPPELVGDIMVDEEDMPIPGVSSVKKGDRMDVS